MTVNPVAHQSQETDNLGKLVLTKTELEPHKAVNESRLLTKQMTATALHLHMFVHRYPQETSRRGKYLLQTLDLEEGPKNPRSGVSS